MNIITIMHAGTHNHGFVSTQWVCTEQPAVFVA